MTPLTPALSRCLEFWRFVPLALRSKNCIRNFFHSGGVLTRTAFHSLSLVSALPKSAVLNLLHAHGVTLFGLCPSRSGRSLSGLVSLVSVVQIRKGRGSKHQASTLTTARKLEIALSSSLSFVRALPCPHCGSSIPDSPGLNVPDSVRPQFRSRKGRGSRHPPSSLPSISDFGG